MTLARSTTRVLVVEDEDLHYELMTAQLGDGMKPWRARTLVEALALATTNDFEVALLDLSLPDSRGLETVSRFTEACRFIPTVVLTSLADDTLGAQTIERGAQDYLVKDEIDGRILRRTLRYAIARHEHTAVLARKNEMLGLWLTVASHDLSTPLLTLSEGLDAIREGTADLNMDERIDLAEGLAMAVPALQRTKNTVEAALRFARLDDYQPEPEPVSFEDIVAETAHELSDALKTQRATLAATGHLGVFETDGRLLLTILRHLLENAIAYGPVEGAIEIVGRSDGDFRVFEVRDRGPGIPAHLVEEAFIPLRRLGDSANIPGLGLGLAIARRGADLLRGDVVLLPREGGGTVARLTLPSIYHGR